MMSVSPLLTSLIFFDSNSVDCSRNSRNDRVDISCYLGVIGLDIEERVVEAAAAPDQGGSKEYADNDHAQRVRELSVSLFRKGCFQPFFLIQVVPWSLLLLSGVFRMTTGHVAWRNTASAVLPTRSLVMAVVPWEAEDNHIRMVLFCIVENGGGRLTVLNRKNGSRPVLGEHVAVSRKFMQVLSEHSRFHSLLPGQQRVQ